jgi:hypothetical protein
MGFAMTRNIARAGIAVRLLAVVAVAAETIARQISQGAAHHSDQDISAAYLTIGPRARGMTEVTIR